MYIRTSKSTWLLHVFIAIMFASKYVYITLTINNAIEFQSGDVIGYYHPPDSHFLMRDIQTDGYCLYRFNGSPAANNTEDLSLSDRMFNNRQPLLQFDIGMYQ